MFKEKARIIYSNFIYNNCIVNNNIFMEMFRQIIRKCT